MPGAQIVGVPAISDSAPIHASVRPQFEVPRLSIRPRYGLGVGSGKARIVACRRQSWWARVRDRSRDRVPVGIDLEAVVVGKVAVAGNAGLAMLVIKLVVAGRGPMEKFESAIGQVERLLKVRILAYLVLQISERSRRRRASWPQSDSQWPPGIATERCWCRETWGWCRLHAQPHLSAPSRRAGRRCRQPLQARAICHVFA